MVMNWVAGFKHGCVNTNDEPRSERSKTTTIGKIIENGYCIALDDRRVKARETADIMGISNDNVHQMLTKELDMKNSLRDRCGCVFSYRSKN